MASLKPDIYLLHDIIRDSDIEFIKVLAGPRVRTLYIILCIWVLKENIRGIKASSPSFMFEAYLAEGVQPVVPFNAPLRIRRFFVSSWLVFCAKFCQGFIFILFFFLFSLEYPARNTIETSSFPERPPLIKDNFFQRTFVRNTWPLSQF